MRIFSTLCFERQDTDPYSGKLRETISVKVFVPGVNSGAYDKALCITTLQTRPFRFFGWLKWKFGSKEVMTSKIVLNEDEMIRLRDEINQILRLPF